MLVEAGAAGAASGLAAISILASLREVTSPGLPRGEPGGSRWELI